jgi:hypothetical protein
LQVVYQLSIFLSRLFYENFSIILFRFCNLFDIPRELFIPGAVSLWKGDWPRKNLPAPYKKPGPSAWLFASAA